MKNILILIDISKSLLFQVSRHVYRALNNSYLLLFFICSFLSFWILPIHAQQQRKIDSLNIVLKATRPDTNRVNAFYYLSDAYYNTAPDKAIEYANQGLSLANKIGFTIGESICLNSLGISYYQLGKFDTALIYFEKRLEIVTRINDRRGIASTYDNMGIIYIHFGDTDKALKLRKKANEIYTELNELSSLANGYNWIGNIYKERGEYAVALENYLKAVRIFEDKNDDQNIAYSFVNISSIYRYMKQYEKAKKYALDAKSKFEVVNNPNGAGASLYRLALIYFEEKKYDDAIKYLLEAKQIFEETRNSYSLTLLNLLLGTCNQNKGNLEIAIDLFSNALVSAQLMGDKSLISAVLQNLSIVYYSKGDYNKSLDYILKSEKYLIEIKDKKALRDLSANFIDIYSRLNKPDSVVKYFQRYQQLSDTIFNEQNSKSLAEVQTRYETEKKDQQLLLQEVTLKNKNLVIKASLAGGGVILVSLIIIVILYRKKNQAYKRLVYQNLSIAGFKQPALYSDSDDLIMENENGITEAEKFNYSMIDEVQKKHITECLTKLIEDKIYTESGLTLSKLADRCGTNRTYLSIVINEKFQANFNTFINKLRIDEAGHLLSKANCNIPLKELYQKLGFVSYSTFNEAFKKYIGVTPAFYQKTAREVHSIALIESN
jgi:tetratricopeptide (TPR) repeat protein/AraC-like DNA-binding protein